jgi:CHAD domain-containing protein
MGPVLELSFRVASNADTQAIARHPLVVQSAGTTATVTTTYFDTAEGALECASMLACEQRAQRRRQIAVIAREPIQPGVAVRRFWAAPCGAGVVVDAAMFAHIPGLPHELRARLAGLNRDAGTAPIPHDVPGHTRTSALDVSMSGTSHAFAPRFSIVVKRSAWQCVSPGGVPLEVVLERGKLVLGEHSTPVCELRLSMAGDGTLAQAGDPRVGAPGDERAGMTMSAIAGALEHLFAFAQALQTQARIFPGSMSSIDAGYARLRGVAAEPVKARPLRYPSGSTAPQALRAVGLNIATHWYGNESGTRDSDDIEFLHQSRVALRRARTAGRLFNPWLDDRWKQHVEPDLKWLASLLGDARDWDVFVGETLPALIDAERDTYSFAPVASAGSDTADAAAAGVPAPAPPDVWRSARAQAEEQLRHDARRAVQDALRSERYARLSLSWLHWLARVDAWDDSADQAQRALPVHARKRLRKLARRVKSVTSLQTLSAQERHAQRIRAKRLRYALEFFAPLLSRRTLEVYAPTVSRIQDTLGAGNDAAVALRFSQRLELSDTQRGFIRGYAAASQRMAARDSEQFVKRLKRPRLAKKLRSKT